MIGITAMARFAGVMGWPAVLPALRQGGVAPHRSRVQPVQRPTRSRSTGAPVLARRASAAGADQRPCQGRQTRRSGARADLPVGRRLLVSTRHRQRAVPEPAANGGGLVLFDINRNTKIGPAASNSETILARLVPGPARTYRLAVVTNENPNSAQVRARHRTGATTTARKAAAQADLPARVLAVASGADLPDERFAVRPAARGTRRNTGSTFAR